LWAAGHAHHLHHHQQNHVDQRAGSDAPQGGAGARRRVHISHPAQGPEHNVIRGSSHLAEGQGMAIFVEQDDGKKRQILDRIPDHRGVTAGAGVDFEQRHQKPGPMQEDINPGKAEQVDRALANAPHNASYSMISQARG